MDELTPSETVLLNGERFARRGLVDNVRLMGVDRKVAADDLARVVLSAAVLANDERDGIRLTIGDRSRWFGFGSQTALFVEPGRDEPSWPEYTLE